MKQLEPARLRPQTNHKNETDANDLRLVRDDVRRYCSAHDFANYDCVNLIITLKRTAHEFNNFTEDYCEAVGLTPGRLNVLMILNSRPDKMFPLSELGEYLVVTRANITGLIDGLVRDGLVRRVDHPQDRRMVLAQLTEKGRKFMAWFAPRHHQKVKNFLGGLSQTEKRQLVALLDKLRAHLRTQRVEKQRA